MTTTGAERRDTAASPQPVFALYMTLLFTAASLVERDEVSAVAALGFAVVAASFWARHRYLVRRGRFTTSANRGTPRSASFSAVVLTAALAALTGGEPLLHEGRWTGDGPAFFLAALTTAAVAALVWRLLVRRDRRRSAAQAS